MKSGILSKLKKALIVVMILITTAFLMPVRSSASILADFVDLVLFIPDGIMDVINHVIAGADEFTSGELNLKGIDDGGTGCVYNFLVTPYEIFSSGYYEDTGSTYKVNIGWLDINFFADKKITSEGTPVSSEILAPVVGNMYKALRNLAMILMLLIILYIGIKILISSIAAQQAKYKQFLVDWVVGFCLLFIMHYIMSGIVNINTLVVGLMSNDEGDSYYLGISELGNFDTWNEVMKPYTNADLFISEKNMKSSIFNEFKNKRISVCPGGTYKVTDHGAETGNVDLSLQGGTGMSGKAIDVSKWGKNGNIYLSATVFNNGHEDDSNKAILKLNAMSYSRTISSFTSGSEWFTGNNKVLLYENGTRVSATDNTSMGYSALYLCLVIETIMFLFIYIKRVLQMAFLTMIAPVVAIMYPVDKLGDGKAQAFNTWFKDYLFNILIQPMHLLLYTIFIVAGGQLISRNILYGLAIYGFMIPAEKYFKKILGFEKASTAGGGPLGGAIGRGLAMDGLGKLAGIGPAGKKYGSGDGKGGSGKGSRKMKLSKNPLGSGGPSAPGADGGNGGLSNGLGAGLAGGLGGASASRGQQSNRRGASASSGQQSSRRGASPSSGGVPNAGGKKKGLIPALARTGWKRTIRGASNGKYSSYAEAGGGKGKGFAANAKAFGKIHGSGIWEGMKFAGKKGSELAFKAGGIAYMGAVGLVAGTATAMATGDVNNIWKGATVGIGAGNKIGQNAYDNTAGFLDDFRNDVNADRAANDPDYNAKLRQKEAKEDYRDYFEKMSEGEDKEYYIEARDEYSPYIDLNGDEKKIDALKAINDEERKNHYGYDLKTKVDIFNEANRWADLKDSKRRDDYLEYLETELGITDVNEKQKRLKVVKTAQKCLGK